MPERVNDHASVLRALDDAVADAAGFLAEVDEDLHDGHQTAREVLCHFVFWHREYVQIAQALSDGCQPSLRRGTFAQLNAVATTVIGQSESPPTPARNRSDQSFLVRPKSVAQRLPEIEGHLRGHIRRLRRAERLGEAWVKAYYPDQE
jgi:hypothetical protein